MTDSDINARLDRIEGLLVLSLDNPDVCQQEKHNTTGQFGAMLTDLKIAIYERAQAASRPPRRPDPAPRTHTWVPESEARHWGLDPDLLPAMDGGPFGAGGLHVQVPVSVIDRVMGRAS